MVAPIDPSSGISKAQGAMAHALEILRNADLEPFTETQRQHQVRRAVASPLKMTPAELRAGPALDGLYLLGWIAAAFTGGLKTLRSIRRLLGEGHASDGAPQTLMDCIDAVADEVFNTSEPYNRFGATPVQIGRHCAPSYYELIGRILADLVRIEESELPLEEYGTWLKDVDAGHMMAGLQQEIARVGPVDVAALSRTEQPRAPARVGQQQSTGPVLAKAQPPEAAVNKAMTFAQKKRHQRREVIRQIVKGNGGTVPPHKDIVSELEKRGITCKANTVTHDLRALRPEQ